MHRWSAGTLILAAVLGTSGSVVAQVEPEPDRPSPYERSVEREVRAALDRLEGGLRLWVDRSRWENAWRTETEHFEVRNTSSRDLGERIADGLEKMIAWFRYILGEPPRAVGRMKVFVLPDMETYNRFGEDFGGFHSSKYGSFFAPDHPERPTISFHFPNELLVRQWLTHSVLHQYLDRCYPIAPPPWIDEGLASYFEVHWDYPNKRAGFRHMMQAGRFVPLDLLFEDTIEDYTEDHFSELGMLFYYLLHEREDTRFDLDPATREVRKAPFRDYLRKVVAGQDVTDDPIHALVTGRVSELESDFRNHTFPEVPRW
jgi:hypothetical protein